MANARSLISRLTSHVFFPYLCSPFFMADKIQLLPDVIANQIAAGEVIQRPASAIKELMENAIDAGATHIKVIVKAAGKTLLQVIDNGSGMSETDARMCFEKHATSKIRTADDLFDIRTMGFAPKPQAPAYASVVAAGGIAAPQAAMFDDIARNLSPARALGMTTVWLKTDSPWGEHGPLLDVAEGDIDHETGNLTDFLQTIRI